MAGPGVTVSAYLERGVGAPTEVVRPNTLSGYRTDLLHVDRSGLGRVKLWALAPEDVERLYAFVLESGCKPGSVAHVRRTISAALTAAARRGHILRNPVPLADMPRADEDNQLALRCPRDRGHPGRRAHAPQRGPLVAGLPGPPAGRSACLAVG